MITLARLISSLFLRKSKARQEWWTAYTKERQLEEPAWGNPDYWKTRLGEKR